MAVVADLVGGANPGEKKSCYRGEKGRKNRAESGSEKKEIPGAALRRCIFLRKRGASWEEKNQEIGQ